MLSLKPVAFKLRQLFDKSFKSRDIKAQGLNVKSKRGLRFIEFLRNIRIQNRLIISFMLVSLIPIGLIGFMSYAKSSSAMVGKISEYSSQITLQASINTSNEVAKIEASLKDLSLSKDIQDGLTGYEESDDMAKMEFNKKLLDMYNTSFTVKKEILNVYLFYKNENIFSGSTITGQSINKEDMDKVLIRAEDMKGKLLWDSAKEANGKKVLVISKEIISPDDGKKLGFIAMEADPSYFAGLLKDINLGIGSEVMIIDANGNVIADKDKKAEFGSLYKEPELIKKVTSENKSFPLSIQGNVNLVAFSKLSTSNWYVVGTIPYSYLNMESVALRNIIIVIALICFFVALVLSVAIASSISSPLKMLVGLMKVAKEGNLSIRVTDGKKDEIADVLSNFSDMVNNISKLVCEVGESAGNVLLSAEETAKLSLNTHTNSEQIAITIQEIAKGAAQQAEDIADGLKQLSNLSENINLVGDKITLVSRVVVEMKDLSGNALQAVDSLKSNAIETNSVSVGIVDDLKSLDSDMKQIKNIVKLIVAISEQTNLLALNAAIEAARAGAAGSGFAVVADEVKKLAVQSKDASVSINDIISKIQKKTEISVRSANNASNIVEKQLIAVTKTDQSFKTIFDSMEGVANQIKEVEKALTTVQNSKNNVVDTIESLTAVAEESSATSEEVSASTEEQMADAEMLTNLAERLKEMAYGLSKSISIFKV